MSRTVTTRSLRERELAELAEFARDGVKRGEITEEEAVVALGLWHTRPRFPTHGPLFWLQWARNFAAAGNDDSDPES